MKLEPIAAFVLSLSLMAPARGEVKLSRTPDGGIQPKALVDAAGTTHLVSFRGEPGSGDLFYSARSRTDRAFSQAVRINSTPHSAVSVGTIRGGQFALGKDDMVHVVWNGSRTRKRENAPLFYSRGTSGGTFEKQQAVSGDWIMDGGGAVAADQSGRVYVFYHGGRGTGEDSRRVLMRASDDSGKTFGPEKIISPEGLGVCACCSMQAFADPAGRLFVIYRAASDGGKSRNVMLLLSPDHGVTWSHSVVSQWPIAACPMSSMSISLVGDQTWMSWEKEGQIFIGAWNDKAKSVGGITSMPGPASGRKHPVIAAGTDPTHVLIAWTKGTGWNRGGNIGWQIMGSDLRPSGETGHAPGVDVWSLVSAIPLPGGGFEILH